MTKLNFNGATFPDGLPVTLRFADLVGGNGERLRASVSISAS
ncbi:hypothetical protein [Methylocystis echinoides]|nr:hypothetical protein [Methylocystis echinoides]